jgi:hypothetical protein
MTQPPEVPLSPVQLYLNPATSEVTGEYPTLHDAIAAWPRPSETGAFLTCNGLILATTIVRGWLFERAGLERLNTEYNAIKVSRQRP